MHVRNAGVLDKAFLLLEMMADSDGPVQLKDLSEKAGLNKATVHRILQSLSDLEYVAQQADSTKYLVTPRLAFLGRKNYYDKLVERLLPHMEHLNRRFNETVNVGILEGGFVFYLHSLETTQALRWTVKPGARDPFYSTALGRAMVSHLPEPRQKELVARAVFKARTPRTVSTKAELATILAASRSQGWAIDDQENDVGVLCYGIPIIEDGNPVASLSISLPESRLTPALREQMIDELLAVKAAASS